MARIKIVAKTDLGYFHWWASDEAEKSFGSSIESMAVLASGDLSQLPPIPFDIDGGIFDPPISLGSVYNFDGGVY
jgi:hypothetical protein